MKTIAYWWRASANQRLASLFGLAAVVWGGLAWTDVPAHIDQVRGTGLAVLGGILVGAAATGARTSAFANLTGGTVAVVLGTIGLLLHGVAPVDAALLGIGAVLVPTGVRDRARTRSAVVPGPVFEVLEEPPPLHVEGATKAELYEIARELDIGGRSRMTKAELEQAIEEATALRPARAA